MKKSLNLLCVAFLSLFVLGSLSAGGKAEAASGPRKILSAHTQSYVPYGYIDENGRSEGFEIAVLRAVDELLEEYEFEFAGTSDEDLLIGIESGRYAMGTKGAWITEERKKKFLFPENPIAASIIGITFRKADEGKIRDLRSFAEYSGKLVPISPQSAQFAVVGAYNAANPDAPIKLVPSDVFIINDAYLWVLEGRYDAFFDIKLSYQKSVVSETGAFHSLADRLSYVPYKGIPTWPLFNRNETELAAAYDRAIAVLRERGTLAELSVRYFGEDVFQYVNQ